MTLTSGDKSVVSNVRYELDEAVARFTDEQIAQTWREFSQSEDYFIEDDDRMVKFLMWLENLDTK